MNKKFDARVFIALCIVATPLNSLSEPVSNKALATLAGSYLHGAEQIRLVRKTKCAYAMPNTYPTYRQLLETDVLPALPEADRERFRRAAEEYLTSREATNQRNLEAQFQKLTTAVDEKTACGLLAGMFLATFESYKLQWEQLKKDNEASSK